MASQRRCRTQADADKTMTTRLLNKITAGPVQAADLPAPYRRFLRPLELAGKIRYTNVGWVVA